MLVRLSVCLNHIKLGLLLLLLLFGVVAAYCSNFAPTRSFWFKILRRRGRPPPIIFAPIVRPMNALQICPWQFSHMCYGWGATSENRSSDFAPTRSLWSKISGTRGCPPPIIFARLVRPVNALQLCRWQFSDKETLWQTFFKRSAFLMEIGRFAFLRPPLGDLGATYDDHLRLIGKHVSWTSC